jgi:bifunctional non-homologous end joining protein LigD
MVLGISPIRRPPIAVVPLHRSQCRHERTVTTQLSLPNLQEVTMTLSLTAPVERISLYFKQGCSDKEYHASIESAGTDCVVNFAYGRRGSTLTTGTKTASPVDYATAKKIFDKLIAEKKAKGYTEGEAGTPYQSTPKENRTTGILPQLLNAIEEDQVHKLITDPAWWCQEKLDGKRILIRRSGDRIEGINRSGLIVSLPESIVDAALKLGGMQWILDGEMIGDSYIAFDVLEIACIDLRGETYSRRLKSLLGFVPLDCTSGISSIDTATTITAKRDLCAALKRGKREGIVLKRKDAPYTPGRPASGGTQLKLKFVATASCIVAGLNGGKRSVKLHLIDPDGSPVLVGNVTIPSNHPMPTINSVVEIRYLYAFPGGSLFQPVYLGVRDELPSSACTLIQLKLKNGEEN